MTTKTITGRKIITLLSAKGRMLFPESSLAEVLTPNTSEWTWHSTLQRGELNEVISTGHQQYDRLPQRNCPGHVQSQGRLRRHEETFSTSQPAKRSEENYRTDMVTLDFRPRELAGSTFPLRKPPAHVAVSRSPSRLLQPPLQTHLCCWSLRTPMPISFYGKVPKGLWQTFFPHKLHTLGANFWIMEYFKKQNLPYSHFLRTVM